MWSLDTCVLMDNILLNQPQPLFALIRSEGLLVSLTKRMQIEKRISAEKRMPKM